MLVIELLFISSSFVFQSAVVWSEVFQMPCNRKYSPLAAIKILTLKILYIFILTSVLISCKTSKPTMTSWNTKSFSLFTTSDTINLTVTYFAKNSVICYTEAIPYALLIGQTNNPSLPSIPKRITVLAKCDNNNYSIGQNIKVLSIEDPTKETTLRPLYVTTDTTINKVKYHWLLGSENPAIWGKVL